MITGELKNKIDRIWEYFWTAGITNPMTVLEQLTYILYMKMLDDRQIQEEQNANAFGYELVDCVFPEGEWLNPATEKRVKYEDMRWHVFKNTGSANMFNMVRNNVFEFIKHIGSGEDSAYSRFMKTAIFLVPDMNVLQDIIDSVDALDLDTTNKDIMGDVYEYCLGKIETSGKNGQFRTPVHIIRMVVEMMQPRPDDVMCDPAMGTAGFMVEGVKYIKRHYERELMDENTYRHFQSNLVHGYDTDQTMLRIGAMNLMLQDVTDPQIDYRDSVSVNNTDEEKYTLCMANPPFKGTVNKNNINPKLTAKVQTNKTELLFLCQFIRSLQLGGRCASVVPDGVLFSTNNAYISIRKELVDRQCLRAVISMPSGVFKPYAGVSTAVLVFTRTDSGGTDKVWFYDMKADGFSLDDKRNPVADNDIPDIIHRFHHLDDEVSRTKKDQSFLVSVDEIREKGYDLSINKYKEVEREHIDYEPTADILARLSASEEEYNQGFVELQKMLGV